MKKINLAKTLFFSVLIILSSCKKDSSTPITNLDCNDVENGTSLTDDCGDCQQAYIYDAVSHTVTLLDDTSGIILASPTEMLIMPNDAGNPYWNQAGCTYTFTYQGQSTVTYSGQTERLDMASEMISALASSTTNVDMLNGMFENSGDHFSTSDLNLSSKQIKSKTAVGAENNLLATEKAAVVALFDGWFADYATNVAPIVGTTTMATSGTAGMVGNRELNAKGMEYDQIVAKSLIGALCLDQVVNSYLSPTKLNVNNTNRDPNEDNNATAMEHHWDEGFGYVYGKFGADNTLGDLSADGLLGKYLNKSGFEAEKAAVFQAFIDGRAAIVALDYNTRDANAAIIKANLSKVVAQKAYDYLTKAAVDVESLNAEYFHGLSEGYGFILSLQFTNDGNGNAWFNHSDVNNMLSILESGNGFWDRTNIELTDMANTIKSVTGL